MIAAQPGTAKVNEVRRLQQQDKTSSVHVVTPDWLWCCAERWERIDERLFPLLKGGAAKVTLNPPPHCSGHRDHLVLASDPNRKFERLSSVDSESSTGSSALPEALNPLLAFSTEELAGMDEEVGSSSDDDSDKDAQEQEGGSGRASSTKRKREEDGSSSEDDSLEAEVPKGWARGTKRGRVEDEDEEEEDSEKEEDDEDLLSMAQELEREMGDEEDYEEGEMEDQF